MKVNFWCRLGIITKQGCVEMALMLNEQITGMLPLGTLSFFTFERQKSAYMRAGVMRCFHVEASVHFLWQYILICRIMLTLIVTCVFCLFWFHLCLDYYWCLESMQGYGTVSNSTLKYVTSVLLHYRKKCPFEYFKSLKEISIYLLLLFRSK